MDTEDLQQHLEAVRRKRGYLLPHHGLMATALPGMLEDYDDLYTSLALTPRHLDRHDHEVVWLVVLISVNEALGTHHIARFREAGGGDEELPDIVALAAFCRGASAWCFVDGAWSPHLPAYDAQADYRRALHRAAGEIPLRVAHLCAIAAHACAGAWDLFRWQLRAAYADGVPEVEIAEALSLMAFPGSVPSFARACGAWQAMIRSGELAPSEQFRVWAALSGQGGYDEASGVVANEGAQGTP